MGADGRPVFSSCRQDINIPNIRVWHFSCLRGCLSFLLLPRVVDQVTISGSVLSWLIELMLSVFDGTVRRTLEQALSARLGGLISEHLNGMVAKIPFVVPIDNIAGRMSFFVVSVREFVCDSQLASSQRSP